MKYFWFACGFLEVSSELLDLSVRNHTNHSGELEMDSLPPVNNACWATFWRSVTLELSYVVAYCVCYDVGLGLTVDFVFSECCVCRLKAVARRHNTGVWCKTTHIVLTISKLLQASLVCKCISKARRLLTCLSCCVLRRIRQFPDATFRKFIIDFCFALNKFYFEMTLPSKMCFEIPTWGGRWASWNSLHWT